MTIIVSSFGQIDQGAHKTMRDLLDQESISRKQWFYKFDEIIIDHKLPV